MVALPGTFFGATYWLVYLHGRHRRIWRDNLPQVDSEIHWYLQCARWDPSDIAVLPQVRGQQVAASQDRAL